MLRFLVCVSEGKPFTHEEFERRANGVFIKRFSSLNPVPPRKLERAFWEEMAWGKNGTVDYGLNVEGSAFSRDNELGQSRWNLQVWF